MQKKYLLIAAITLAALLSLVAAIPAPTPEPTPADQVSQAWALAQASGRYSYNAQIEQTSYPLPSLANSGRQPTNDYLALDGAIDQITNQMDLTLWQDGQTDPHRAIQIKVENGRTLGRVGQTGNWEEINNFTDSFAPGQDPLGFLNAATNIQQTETRTYDFSDGATRPLHIEQSVISPQRSTPNNQLPITNYQYTSYTFTLSGRAYAEHMRQQLEAQLQQYGRLPAGLRLNTADLYRDMSGHGELWIDQNGLPARLIIHMDIPANGETGRAVSTITTTFTNFDQSTLPTPPATSFWQTPTTWLTTHKLDLLTITQQAAITLFILHISYLILLLIRRYWRTETFYKLLVYTLIFTMIIPPLIEAEQAHAFMENMRTDLAEQKARQAEAEAQQKVQEAATTSNWNPHQDPAVGYQLSAVSGQPSAISPNSQFTIHNSQFNRLLMMTTTVSPMPTKPTGAVTPPTLTAMGIHCLTVLKSMNWALAPSRPILTAMALPII